MKVRGSGPSILLMVAVLACVGLLAPGGAAAATVVNGDFEAGNLSGWSVYRATQAGNWFAYKSTREPIANKRPPGQPIQPPPQGTYAAIADQLNPETLILSQDVALEAGGSHWLSLLAYYNSYEPIAVPAPDTLSVDDGVLGGQANQQFRIDVMRPGTPIESIDPADVLLTLFRTHPGGPAKLGPTQLTADLSAFAGQTVRLRVAVAAHEEVLAAGFDAVSISPSPPGRGGEGSSLGPKGFRVGKAKANRKNGTVTLPVQVSDSGLVTAKGKSASATGTGASRARKSQRPIKLATVRARAAGTVKLRLKPTPTTRRILERKHKLRVEVAVTYTPNGGAAKTATVPVIFKLAPSPDERR
jgi:hypothetical protein